MTVSIDFEGHGYCEDSYNRQISMHEHYSNKTLYHKLILKTLNGSTFLIASRFQSDKETLQEMSVIKNSMNQWIKGPELASDKSTGKITFI